MRSTPVPDLTRAALSGVVWQAGAIFISKGFGVGSQIILGHVIQIETYAVFALTSTALYFLLGFQNSGAGNALIQESSDGLGPLSEYYSFSLIFGSFGLVFGILLAATFQPVYRLDYLFFVIAFGSLSIPLVAHNHIAAAVLRFQLQFKNLSASELVRSTSFYAIAILSAIFGAEIFTMVLALVASSIAHGWFLRRQTGSRLKRIDMNSSEFLASLKRLRWVIVGAFLLGLSMRSDVLVLGRFLTEEEMGLYFFGISLVAHFASISSICPHVHCFWSAAAAASASVHALVYLSIPVPVGVVHHLVMSRSNYTRLSMIHAFSLAASATSQLLLRCCLNSAFRICMNFG